MQERTATSTHNNPVHDGCVFEIARLRDGSRTRMLPSTAGAGPTTRRGPECSSPDTAEQVVDGRAGRAGAAAVHPIRATGPDNCG